MKVSESYFSDLCHIQNTNDKKASRVGCDRKIRITTTNIMNWAEKKNFDLKRNFNSSNENIELRSNHHNTLMTLKLIIGESEKRNILPF